MHAACTICGRRRGQRQCPASGSLICTQCCGKGRRRTIECPDSCPHFRTGASLAVRKLADLVRDYELDERWWDVLHNLRKAIIAARDTRARDLTDEEARQGLANAAETLRVRSRGLIYESRSTDPRIQLVADELIRVALLHEKGEKGLRRVGTTDIASCLRHLEKQAREAAKREPGLFVDLAAQTVGDEYVATGGSVPA